MKQMRTALFCVITQQVVEFLTDVSGQPIGPIFKGQEPKNKAGNPSTKFIPRKVHAVMSLSSLVPANRVDAGGREGGV